MSALAAAARRPGPWAVIAAIGLVVALSLPREASDWLFWGALAVACLGAGGWAFVVAD